MQPLEALKSKSSHLTWHPLSRSYGANLPSSLTWFLSRTLVYSTIPPVSVYGTGSSASTFRSFSWQCGIDCSRSLRRGTNAFQISAVQWADLPTHKPTSLDYNPISSQPSLLRPSITQLKKYRNINLLSIDYAVRPRLRTRLTPGGRTFPGKPWNFGDRDSHPVFRYLCLHGHFCTVQHGSPHIFSPIQNALLSLHFSATRIFGYILESRLFSAQNHSTSELLRTL